MTHDEGFLSRWSRKKREAASPDVPHAAASETAAAAAQPAAIASDSPAPTKMAGDVRAANEVQTEPTSDRPSAELPPTQSLSFESDFTPFLRAGVDESVKRDAMKKLFHSDAFNYISPLDVYIDDYTKPDPIPEWMLKQLNHAKGLIFPAEEDTQAPKNEQAQEPANTGVSGRPGLEANSGAPSQPALPESQAQSASPADHVTETTTQPTDSAHDRTHTRERR